MARLKITFDELKESVGTPLIKQFQKIADAAISIGNAFGKNGVAGAIEEFRFQLQFLIYDKNGELNDLGKQLNAIIKIYDIFANVSNKTKYLPSNLIGNKVLTGKFVKEDMGTIGAFAGNIDVAERDQRQRLQQIENSLPAPIVVNVNVAAGTDPAVVGRQVKRNLEALDRRGR
jgi:hypothetical protein